MKTKHTSPADKLGTRSSSGSKTYNGDPVGKSRSGGGPEEVTYENVKVPKPKK